MTVHAERFGGFMDIKPMKKTVMAYVAIVLGALYSMPVSAQWSLSLPPPIQTAAYYAADNIGKEVAEDAGRKDRARRGEDNISYTPPAPQASYSSLNFTPNLKKRKDYFNTLLAQYDQTAPGTSAQLRPALFGEGDVDIIQQMQKFIGPEYNLKTNNVADAYTIYWITAWETANGIFDRPTPPDQMKAVHTQVTNIMLSSADFPKLSDAEKQSYAESLLVQASIISTFGEHVKADTANMPKVRSAVIGNANALGVRIETFKLTPYGFVPINRE
jgi:hypothetical protein